ncbi:MAG: Gx transporter family protein [Eubacteriaceae bacterium]|nr:Gx transporter family protein [Eubacteriaceae bacterium]
MAKTQKLAGSSLMLAAIIVLSAIENSFPPVPFAPPGARLGLSNVLLMYSLFFVGKRYAASLALLKAAFAFIARGPTAGIMSAAGGMLSIGLMALSLAASKGSASYLAVSIIGAVSHNIGQMAVASIISGTNLIVFYLPQIIIAGSAFGFCTAVLLARTAPYFENVRSRGERL